MSKRGISPLTTWHSQSGLLLISFTWGVSYVVPERDRIPFSEVFPSNLNAAGLPMPIWGILLIAFAAAAFIAERAISRARGGHPLAWRIGYGAHMALTGVYGSLAVSALFESLSQCQGSWLEPSLWGNIISSVSRTVLWGYIGYLHSTFARLPRIVDPKSEPAHG